MSDASSISRLGHYNPYSCNVISHIHILKSTEVKRKLKYKEDGRALSGKAKYFVAYFLYRLYPINGNQAKNDTVSVNGCNYPLEWISCLDVIEKVIQ